jgi:hypothetical protein
MHTAVWRRWLVFPIFNLQFSIRIFQFLSLLAAGSLAFAADPPPSTDDQLRDSLNSKAGDDYDKELLGDAAKPGGKGRADDELQKKLQKELGAAAQQEGKAEAPLLKVAKAMRAVPPLLDRRNSGTETQLLQTQIVSDLEKLIEAAKKSGSGGKNSPTRKPTGGEKKPAQKPGQTADNNPQPAETSDPTIRKPENRAAAAAKTVRQMIELFGPELPQRDRQQMLELPSECFLPEYELEIEDYFRRLSEDQPDARRP